jgi:exodeoxyribonuclease VIII
MCCIKENEYKDIMAMRDHMIPEGDMYLNGDGKVAEPSFYWYEDKVLCKCRPDVICQPRGPHKPHEIVVVDYKTTYSCSPEYFKESVLKYGYAEQAAWYRRGMEAAGYSVKEFVFVAQEKKPPYASKVFIITDKQMDVAWEIMNTHLENIKRCMKGNKPTIYNSPNIVTLDLENEIT